MDWLLPTLMAALLAPVSIWIAGAIYYDVAGAAAGGRRLVAAGLAFAWLGVVVAALALWQPMWLPFVVLLGFDACFVGWWLSQKPRNDRDWDVAVAVLPRAVRDGDAITIENVRNFEYQSLEDFTPRYESRTYHLSNLRGVDAVFFTWSPWMSHPVLTFDFGVDGRICMSIEVRFRKGQGFDVVRSFYRQQEIIFLAVDERDLILRRTKHSQGQDAYQYRLVVSDEQVRAAFLDYVDTINRLNESPQWYHAMCANCTTSFYQLPGSRRRCDWRVLANGRLDEALYDDGRIERCVPFAERRRRAYLNDIANRAPEEGFGDHIRRELERLLHER